jgi:PKD repeat protein
MKNIVMGIMLCATYANAQITVNNTDMPVRGDTLRYSIANTVDVTSRLALSGANQTWNFSDLRPASQNIASFKRASDINAAYSFTFTGSTYGTEASNTSFGGLLQASDVFSFYTNSSSSYACDGRGFEVSGSPLPLTQTYSGKDVVYKFPMNFGNKDSNTYISNSVNALVVTLNGGGKRVNMVDAWGSLTTPLGTFDCLRVKSQIITYDTVRSSLLPIPFPITQNVTEYKWIAKGQKIPLLEIRVPSGGGGQTTINYRDRYRPEAYENKARFTIRGNKLTYAVSNNSDTCVLNNSSLNNPNSVQWTITPNTFTFTGGTNATTNTVKIFFTDTGKYTIKLRANYNGGFDDTTRVNIITVAKGPVVKFGADRNATNTTAIVQLIDSSEGNPTSWKWTITPNTVSYVGGTKDTSQNPKVIFDVPGTYSVSLRITNAITSATLTKTDFINSYNTAVKEVSAKNHGWQLSPNPVTDKFWVKTTGSKIKGIELFDITGKMVHPQVISTLPAEWELDCSNLKPGIYFAKLTNTQGEMETRRISVK